MRRKEKPLRAAKRRASELYQRGSVDEALAEVIEARKHAPSDGKGLTSDEAAALAEGWEFQAAEELYKGRLQAGLEGLLAAEQVLDGRPELNELLGRICAQIGSQLAVAPNLRPMQEEYLARARSLLAGMEDYQELLEFIPGGSSEEQGPWQVRRSHLLEEVRSLARKHHELPEGWHPQEIDRLFRLSAQAMYIGIEEGDDKAAREGFVEAAHLVLTFCSDDSGPFFEYAQIFSHLLDRPHFGLGEELSQVAQIAMRLAESSKGMDHLSEAYLLAALRDREIQDLQSCLKNVSSSVWYGQQHQVQDSPSVMMRAVTKHRLDEKRALATEVAIELEQPEFVAELIETARLQALADTAQFMQFNPDTDYDLAGLMAVTRMSLQEVQPVSVGGRSRVAEAEGKTSSPDPLPLEPSITAVGGPDAVYWGHWVALRKCYWAVRDVAGKWSAGMLDLGANPDTLLTADSELHPPGNLQTLTMLEDQGQEASLNRTFGELVIPPPLADTLKAARAPVSLVVAGAFACLLPLPALVIPGTPDERLIERAVIRVQPPLVLMKNASRQQIARETGDQLFVRIACLDPSGDLPHSRNYDIAAENLLTTPSKREGASKSPAWSRPATRDNLTGLLRHMNPGEPGIFVYSGHVQQMGVPDGPETSLVLADGLLSAVALSALPAPSHVLLSACSSSGASGTGAGEWLGLAGSLLRSGARQITATAWPIPDTEFTARFERELITRLRVSGDAAVALRESQLAALEEWRSRNWRLTPSSLGRVPFPRVWAAYQMIGMIAGM